MITSPNDHVGAKPVIYSAWQSVHGRAPTGLEALYAQSIAALETGYGRLGQFADMASRGLYNWGGVQKAVNDDGTCPPGFALGQDQGTVCFQVYPTDEQAAAKFIWELTVNPHFNRSSVLSAMSGNAEDVATAMKQTGYYEGQRDQSEQQRIAYYTNAIRNRANQIVAALQAAGETVNTSVENKTGFSAGKLLLLGGLIGGGIYGLKKYKGGKHG